LNVNSLNLSSTQSNYKVSRTDEKISYIFSKNADIVFLQDIRLGDKLGTFLKKIKCTKYGNFTAYTNSDKDSRGVAILFNNSLDFSVLSEFRDPDQNLLILDVSLKSIRCSLVCAYGPKQGDNPSFLTDIKTKLISLQNPIYFIAGDLNCIPCLSPPASNIDLKNTLSIPNPSHSRILNKMIEESFFIDTFRSLNPSMHTYSYTPFGDTRLNRSRIDHFLSSVDIFPNINSMTYLPQPKSLFDHKMILITFRKHKFSPPTLDNSNLKELSLKQIAISESWNTLSDYCIFQIDQNLLMEMRVKRMEISSIAILIAKNRNDKLLPFLAENLIVDFDAIILLLPDFNETLENGINISNVVFLQTLVNNISNSITQAQIALKKAKNFNLSSLYKSLREGIDFEVQEDIQDKISVIESEELLKSCQKLKLWEVLNLEKPSKKFARLAKSASKTVDIGCIELHENNTQKPFESKLDQKNYIVKSLKNIYSPTPISKSNIETFLSPEVCNSELVRNKKLSDDQRTLLEAKITSKELFDVINKVNVNAAPGPDQISYNFYKTFFKFLANPILNCYYEMANEGQLKSPFNLCKILLIPKKGCVTNISNWRPISLCNTSYKIFSAAIANRLKDACDKITDIAQKGYSASKNISEAIVNIFNNIKSQKAKGIDVATIALDFSKAFDKVSHDFILKSLKFFNFGPTFINLIKTIITNRFAYIQNLDDETLRFLISSGVPQGLAPSGYLFIISLEILIIRIISETQLFTPIHENANINENTQNTPQIHVVTPDLNIHPQTHDTPVINTGEGVTNPPPPDPANKSIYADDFTMCIIPTPENFLLFKEIMDQFHELSGLCTNYSKTTVMFSSQPAQNTLDAAKLVGLKITASTCVLGFKFDSQLDSVETNLDDAIAKMIDAVNFWKTFYLSLFGRINIWKSLIISKVSYLLAVLSPNYYQTEQIDQIMHDFIAGKLKIAKDKMFLPINSGGLGLTSCRSYSILLKVNLFKRSVSSQDSWAKAIKYACLDFKNGVFLPDHPVFEHFPFSKNILNAYIISHNAYYSNDNNILSADFHDNSLFRSVSKCQIVQNYTSSADIIRIRRILNQRNRIPLQPETEGISISIGAFVLRSPSRCCDKPYVANLLGCHLTNQEYSNIKSFINFIIKKFPTCGNFGYNPLKKILSKKISISKIIIPIITRCNLVKTLSRNRGTIARYNWVQSIFSENVVSQESSFMTIWKIAKLDNVFKSFCFEFTQNILYSNEQKAKFIPNFSPECNICLSYGILPPPKESIKHLFLSCPTIQGLRREFIQKLDLNGQLQELDELTVCGSTEPVRYKRNIVNLYNMFFNFIIYKHRNIPSIKMDFLFFFRKIENMLSVLKDFSIQKEDLTKVLSEYYKRNV
jgi:exonuclease III